MADEGLKKDMLKEMDRVYELLDVFVRDEIFKKAGDAGVDGRALCSALCLIFVKATLMVGLTPEQRHELVDLITNMAVEQLAMNALNKDVDAVGGDNAATD